ncbi:MAG: ribosome maturation factor RimM [Proteobacteria bacterium]|nr:ribosome maturation factor RimM [Pseudomonadota bacterium]
MSTPQPSRRLVCVARIGAAHGVRGEVRLWSFTADPMAVANYGLLETADGARAFRIASLRPTKASMVARIHGVCSRTEAEKLCNLELYVARDRLPPPADDEFYHSDLIGLAVHDTAGAVVGEVVALHDFGAGDLIEVRPANGRATMLVPFNKAAVPVIDFAGARLVIDPPTDVSDDV